MPAGRAGRGGPHHLSLSDWWQVARRVLAGADRGNLGLISAGVAFYALLSVFPAVAALVAIWGVAADPQMIAGQLDLAQRLLPEGGYDIIRGQVEQLVGASDRTLRLTTLFSVLLAVVSARSGIAALIRGLNSVYRENHRTTLKRYAIAIGLTAVLIVVALVAIAAVVLLPMALALAAIPFGIEAAITVLKWLVLFALFLVSVGLVYRYGPNRRGARVPWLTPGALFALVAWAAGSAAFSLYLRNFGSFNEVYGSIGAVIALLFWFYLSAYVVLLGALLNAELELQTAEDTTIGAPRPPGQRRAFVADHTASPDGGTRLAPVPATPPEPKQEI